MQIIIRGSIVLSDEEVRDIYEQQKAEYMKEDIELSSYNCPPEKIHDLVELWQYKLNKSDNYWEDYWAALDNACEEMEVKHE